MCELFVFSTYSNDNEKNYASSVCLGMERREKSRMQRDKAEVDRI